MPASVTRSLFATPIVIMAAVYTLAACSTSPLGQQQLTLVPQAQMNELGAEAYRQIRRDELVVTDAKIIDSVRCVARHITDAVGGDTSWEVHVFQDREPNAFALPGGKIGVNSGLLDLARNQHQLAVVIGHEVAHLLAEHTNARLSAAYATEAGLQVIQLLSNGAEGRAQLMGLLGLGAQYGVLMPYSRAQEREADLLGLDLMAKAGFRPEESVAFWQNMGQHVGIGAPALLSTHPGHGQRIESLQKRMPHARELFRQSIQRPDCR